MTGQRVGDGSQTTHIVLLLHVHLACRPPHVQLLLLGHLAHLAVVLLVSDRRGRSEDEGAGDDDGHEGQPKGEERVLAHEGSVSHAELVGVGRRAECLVLERRHRDCDCDLPVVTLTVIVIAFARSLGSCRLVRLRGCLSLDSLFRLLSV